MKYNIKKILKDIKDFVEGAENNYINALGNNYRDYALTVLTLNYYMLYESGMDYEEYKNEDINNYIERLSPFIVKYIINDEKIEEKSIIELDNIRNTLISKVDVLLNYTAKFYIYEYILNRLEYNFEQTKDEDIIEFDDNNFANRVVEYIFNNNDNVIINSKIQSVLGQLPVRMTKGKFFDLLRDSFTIYKGTTIDCLESYVDRITTSGTIFKIEENSKILELHEELLVFDGVDYSNIDYKTFEELQKRYRKVSRYIEVYTNFYSDYTTILNMIYVIMLAKYNITSENYDELYINNTKDVINHINDCFKSMYSKEIDDEISEKLVLLEGIQEKCYDLCITLEQGLSDKLLDKYIQKDNKVSLVQNDLMKCSKLISNSIFMTLEDKTYENVDESMLNDTVQEIIESFKELFNKSSKVYTRAVMANVLSELPVFFKDIAEVSDYVNNQITSCRNESEKMACYVVLSDMMDVDYYD